MDSCTAKPTFPTELIEKIISDAWSSSLSVNDRITLMTSSLLVNKTWQVAYLRTSSKDMHIPCVSYVQRFLAILRRDSPIYNAHPKLLPEVYCNSLTFHVERDAGSPYTEFVPTLPSTSSFVTTVDTNPMGKAVANALYAIKTLNYLPNLRKISIEYVNWGYDDLFDNYRLITFPDQVTDLELKYRFSPNMPPWLLQGLRSAHERDTCLPWSLGSIRTLTVLGAGSSLVLNMAGVCTNLETLAVDGSHDFRDLSPLPESVHNLVVDMPSTQLTDMCLKDLTLSVVSALDAGLFAMDETEKSLTFTESAAPKSPTPAWWELLSRGCEIRGVHMHHILI